ncbi:MAG: ASKHA domain-containing protein [Acidimicrobiia bacterium]|nr:ASKHA domain-containing protein [Acidimicrobiia bacterium]
MPEVVFLPAGRRAQVDEGVTVLDAARTMGVDLDSICSGRGICGRCQIRIGSTPAIPARDDSLSPPGPTETAYRGKRPLRAGMRLGCAAHIVDDVVIDVPAESQVHRQVVRKRAEVASLPVDPIVKLHYVEVEPPDLARPTGDAERLLAALERDWSLTELGVDDHVLMDLQRTLREGKWKVTVAVRARSNIVAIWAGFEDRVLGAAFDIGSTTIAGHLCDLSTGEILASAGRMNPQIGYGEDLMSRVSYVLMNADGASILTAIVRSAVDEILGELCIEASVARTDVLELSIVGNPIMHHLLFGFDPRELGTAPFALVTTGALTVRASWLGLEANTGARVYGLPCIAGHVGADTAGCVLSEAPHRSDGIQLLVDVGTNAEIVIGNRERLLAASSPTGPAFEGAAISDGQRAAPGAVERIRIDPATLEPSISIIGVDGWSSDPAAAEAIAASGVTGICGSGIIEAVVELRRAGVIDSKGVIRTDLSHPRLVAEGRTASYRFWDDPELFVTQNDVRAIQLAKAALRAGIDLLMDHLGVDQVDDIRLAGAFGANIDPAYAMALGMIPDCALDRVHHAGNAAGTGAMIALLSHRSRAEIEEVAASIHKIETATEPRFQEAFVEAMAIPHLWKTIPHLAGTIDFPPDDPGSVDARRPRRRQR